MRVSKGQYNFMAELVEGLEGVSTYINFMLEDQKIVLWQF